MTQTKEQVFADAADKIKKYGFMVTAVFPTQEDHGPEFAYTVGLTNHNHPELIIFGLDPYLAHSIVNRMGRMVIDDKVRWVSGESDQVFDHGVLAQIIAVSDSSEHLTMANAMFREAGVPVPALQVVYPDNEGRWPWEPDCLVAAQPVLR